MKAPFRILKFYTKYVQRGGAQVPVDYVDICGHGLAQSRVTPHAISHISKVITNGDPDNVAWRMATERWDYIRPHYEAWKKGQELPTEGTPLGAWPAISAEQAEILRATSIRSVEDVASLPDSALGRIPMPGIRDLQIQAKAFLDNKGGAMVAAKLAEKDKEMAELREQLEEMKRIVLEREPDLAADGSEAPRRRGRPSRQPVDEVAA